MTETIIIGAGITGLSCAYHLKNNYLILERDKNPGGLCKSVKTNGFTFDCAGHFLHLHKPYTKRLVPQLLKNNIKKINRKAYIHTHKTYIPYPFQANLYNLPDKVKDECLKGFMKKQNKLCKNDPCSFYDWSLETFGSGITRYFMKPFNEKLWTVSSKVLTSDWVAPFVPQPTLKEVKNSAFNKQKKSFGYNVSFYYPLKGGCQSIIDVLCKKVKNLELSTGTKEINVKNKYVITTDGRKIYYKNLISTQPLPLLLDQITELPKDIRSARKKLSWNSVYCLNLGVKKHSDEKNNIPLIHWSYFPEKKFVFYRVGIYSNIIPSMAPDGCKSFYVEISHQPGNNIKSKKTFNAVIDGLKKCSYIGPKDKVTTINWLPIQFAYVIYDKYRQLCVDIIRPYLESNNIYSIGRYGGWKYSFIEESILEGKKISDILKHQQ